MRDIRTMVSVFQCLIPLQFEDVHHQLKSIESSTNFAPPELDGLHWTRLGELMANAETTHGQQSWFKNCEAVLCGVNVDLVDRIAALRDTATITAVKPPLDLMGGKEKGNGPQPE